MFERALKASTASILIVAAAALVVQTRRGMASGNSDSLPRVRGISIQNSSEGTVIVDIAISASVPYRTLLLTHPERLVVDLKGARNATLKRSYPAKSQILEKVRVGQWRSHPATVRVVADLRGTPAFSVRTQASGIRIELKPRTARSRSTGKSPTYHSRSGRISREDRGRTLPQGPAPKAVFPVHQFKDLSASLTAPELPPHDRLVPVTNPDLSTSNRRKKSTTLALVSGVSIKPESHGETYVDIASTRSVPYRVFQLTDPFRLVVDLEGARNASQQNIYQVGSPVLKRVRVAQWHAGDPAVVRVVADLKGYPIFDVHAQRPGIRIELRPRQKPGPLIRNPFDFATQRQNVRVVRPATPSTPSSAAATNSPAAAPGSSFSDLKVIGYVEKRDSGVQAVISDRANIYFVPKGGAVEDRFKVIAISSNAVEIQNVKTSETAWLPYTP